MHTRKPSFALTLLSCGFVVFWLAAAAVLPVVQDEAYYFQWARFPDFGYFDHPPLVTLTALSSRLADSSAFAGRLFNIILAALILKVSISFFRKLGLSDQRSLLAATLLAFANVLGLAFGVLTTPDTWLVFAWVVALSEAVTALTRDERRWVSAGVATGLGLWAKYIMVLIGPVFLWALIAQTVGVRQQRTSKGPRGLYSKWPYLGGVAALLVFVPHLYWNAQNDWITIRFQLRHGFSLDRPVLAEQSLPTPLPKTDDGPEAQLAEKFRDLRQATAKEEKKKRPYDPALKSLNRYVGYYGSQIAIWGGFVGLFGYGVFSRYRRRRQGAPTNLTSPFLPEARSLLTAACVVPLVFFGAISLVSKVEANWSGMYVFAAAALLAPWAARHMRLTLWGAALNVGLMGLYLAHARAPFLPVRPHKDRLLLETHGYDDLARHIRHINGIVFADSFQLTALMRFYEPAALVRQWPGITRPSEFLRRGIFSDVGVEELRQAGGFHLLTTDEIPPRLPGFTASSMSQMRDCLHEGFQVIDEARAQNLENRCRYPVHVWYLVQYEESLF